MSIGTDDDGVQGWIIDQAHEILACEDYLALSGKELLNGAFLGYDIPRIHNIIGKSTV